MTTYTPGQTYHGFTLIEKQNIQEINSTVYYFQHNLLGCRAFAIKNEDPNKTFCTAFMTIPEDSSGVAHILEHSVLMGSKKYPIHDVFGEINKGGLMTFLNAMTGGDTTWYPFATRNEQEYFNIMDVYCDVTLHPLLEKTTFEQEGWHYHAEKIEDKIEYSGVVLNEMRGAFSDPIRSLFHHTYEALLPGSTYAHESGGDPANIPDLTYEQFVSFHQNHYHPSNATFFFYGNAELDKELSFLQDNFLADFNAPVSRATINPGFPITEPANIEATYAVQPDSELSQKTFIAVSSIVGGAGNKKENTAFQIIAQILFNSDASPLKNAIIEAGLCRDFGGLFIGSMTSTIMMTFLIGSDPDKRELFLELYRKTLGEMVAKKLDRELIISELNKFEFSSREEMNKAQRGLDLISRTLSSFKFNLDPFEAIQNEKLFAEIRKEALDNDYFEQLIQKLLIDNPASAVVTLLPNEEKLQITMEKEQQKLAQAADNFSDEQLQGLVQRTNELIARQTTPNTLESLHLLPTLAVKDLDIAPAIHTVQTEQLAGCQFIINDLPTNGICYIDLGLDCRSLPVDALPYLEIFATIATEIGSTNRDFIQFTTEMNQFTGGFSHSFNTYLKEGKRDATNPVAWFHVKTLTSNLEKTIELLADVFANLDLSNHQRIREIVQREYGWMEHSVQSEGYSLASTRAFSHLSLAGKYNETTSGVHAYLQMKNLAENYEELEENFINNLKTIQELLFSRRGLIISITADSKGIQAFKDLSLPVIESFPDTNTPLLTPEFMSMPLTHAFSTSAEVVYNVQSCTLFEQPAHYNGSFEVLKTWISRDYLWNTVRQQGGAYGCFIQFNHLSGNCGIVSYRDPQVEKTYAAYEVLPEKIATLAIDDTVLNQLIIGTYGNFTPHQGPAALGASARNDFLSGITNEFRQQRIEEIIKTNNNDLKEFAPYFENFRKSPIRTTIGNKEKIMAADNLFEKIEIL